MRQPHARRPARRRPRPRHLGFQVVARLARRYRLQVQLATTPGGGLTALIVLPAKLISHRPLGPGGARGPGPRSRPVRRCGPARACRSGACPTPTRSAAWWPRRRPAARRGGELARELRGMAIPRIGAEPVPPAPAGRRAAARVPRPAVPHCASLRPGHTRRRHAGLRHPTGATPAGGTPPAPPPRPPRHARPAPSERRGRPPRLGPSAAG